VKVKSLYKHLRPIKWYNDLFDKIVKDGADSWRESTSKLATNPSEKQLSKLKNLG